MLDKKRISVHEAGHVTMHLLWRDTWHNATLTRHPDGQYSGQVKRLSYLSIDTPERRFIKDWTISLAGLIAENILLKKHLNWKSESPGCYNDMLRAQTEGLKRMSKEQYASKFAPLVMKFTDESLKKNWDNCVMIIAEELCMWDATTPQQLKPLIKTLNYPSIITLNEVVGMIKRMEMENNLLNSHCL